MPRPTVASAQVMFEDLPLSTRNYRSDELPVADMLRGRPNEWARVFTTETQNSATQIAQQIRTGRRAAFKQGFEAKSRTVDGEYRVYVRYVPATS